MNSARACSSSAMVTTSTSAAAIAVRIAPITGERPSAARIDGAIQNDQTKQAANKTRATREIHRRTGSELCQATLIGCARYTSQRLAQAQADRLGRTHWH